MTNTDIYSPPDGNLAIPPGTTILLVEPSATTTEIVECHLAQATDRLSTRTVATADEATSVLADCDVDCVISEYDLPDSDGIEFLRSVRSHHPNLPFIIYTDTGSVELASEAISADVTEYVLKTTDNDARELTNAVLSTLHRTSTYRESNILERLLEIVPMGVAIHDVEGEMIEANDRGRELLGIAKEEPISDRVDAYEAFNPDGSPVKEENLPPVKAFITGAPVYDETLVVRDADGDPMWVSMSSAPMYDETGENVVRVVSIGQEITELKQHERDLERTNAQLKRTQNRFEALTENASVAVLSMNQSSTIQFANDTVEDVFGYAPDELEGEPIDRLIPNRLLQAHYASVRSYLETGTRRLDWSWIELPACHASGDEIEIGLSFGTTEVDGEQLFTAVARDITEEKEKERELERKRDQLQETVAELRRSNEELEQFAHAVSHDLKEPMRMVSSYLELLERRYGDSLDEEADEFIGHAVDGITRAQRMVDDLLEYSRVSHSATTNRTVDLNEVVTTVERDLMRGAVDGRLDLAIEKIPPVTGNRTMLEKLFQNLLTNAINHSKAGSVSVEITAQERDRRCVVSVSDDGPGIPPEARDRMFDLFQTGPDSDGTGVGLALCEKIVHSHGGEIWLESRERGGTTFSFSLPTAA